MPTYCYDRKCMRILPWWPWFWFRIFHSSIHRIWTDKVVLDLSYNNLLWISMRAIRARYHPYSQTRGRVDQLRRLGHSVDKVEFIVMGGTFMSLDSDYKDFFIRNLHDALSGHHSSSVAEAISFSEQSTWVKSMLIYAIFWKSFLHTIITYPVYCAYCV